MLSNNKGFTLVELIIALAIISILAIIAVPDVLDTVTTSKQELSNILLDDIVTASKNYYEECKYSDKSPSCQQGEPITITIKDLLGSTSTSTKSQTIINPTNKEDISDCHITINETKEESQYTYTVTGTDDNPKCPQNQIGSTN